MRRQQSIKDKQAAEQKSQQEYEALQRRAQQKRIEKERIEKQQNTPKCPTCGSTNICKYLQAKKHLVLQPLEYLVQTSERLCTVNNVVINGNRKDLFVIE